MIVVIEIYDKISYNNNNDNNKNNNDNNNDYNKVILNRLKS
jgi:hypothetical protein